MTDASKLGRKAEEGLKESNNLLNSIIGETTDTIFVKDLSGRYVMINPAGANVIGKSIEEIIGKDDTQLFPHDIACKLIKEDQDIMASGKTIAFDEKIPKDDNIRIFHTLKVPYRSHTGNIIGVIGIARDITERKQIEEKLRESEEHYHSIFDNAMDGIGLCAPEGKLVTLNNAFVKITGYSEKELLSMRYQDLTPLEYHDMEAEKMRILLETGTPQEYEKEYIKKNGTRVPLLLNVSVIYDTDGKPILLLAVLKDMTKIKQAEEMLSDSEKRLKAFLENSVLIGWMKDEDGRHVFLSNNYQKVFDVKFEDWKGKTDFELWPSEIAEEFRKNDLKVLTEGNTIEIIERALLPDGSQSWWLNSKFLFIDSSGRKYVGGLGVDITERKKAEGLLNEQKKALEQKNIALSEVLGQIELEKKQIKDNVITNAEHLLLPIIQKLRLTGESRKYVQLLRKNLQELTSSFGTRITEKGAKLTSREIEICNMIKNGLTSKEIAGLLYISFLTIEKHRINIRRKFGITNKDVNLTSFLKTL